jgi:hypothetical protein
MTDTHGEIIVLPNGHFALIDGVPDTCAHDYAGGPSVIHTASGKTITWRTWREWAGYTDEARLQLILFRLQSQGDQVLYHTTECSKCGKVDMPDLFSE